jgi:hypothetical protein
MYLAINGGDQPENLADMASSSGQSPWETESNPSLPVVDNENVPMAFHTRDRVLSHPFKAKRSSEIHAIGRSLATPRNKRVPEGDTLLRMLQTLHFGGHVNHDNRKKN